MWAELGIQTFFCTLCNPVFLMKQAYKHHYVQYKSLTDQIYIVMLERTTDS